MWDQLGFQNNLARKYDILGQNAEAALGQARAANTTAGAAVTNANANAALTSGRQGLLSAQSDLARRQGGLAGAQAGLVGAETAQVAPNAESLRALQGAQGGFLGAQTQNLQNLQVITPEDQLNGYNQLQQAGAPLTTSSPYTGYSRGTAYADGGTRVPGKDQGKDKVPAMLRPGEAVLVPGAAEEMGRDRIAALNAKHNAQEGMQRKAGKGMVREHDCMGTARAGYAEGTAAVEYHGPAEYGPPPQQHSNAPRGAPPEWNERMRTIYGPKGAPSTGNTGTVYAAQGNSNVSLNREMAGDGWVTPASRLPYDYAFPSSTNPGTIANSRQLEQDLGPNVYSRPEDYRPPKPQHFDKGTHNVQHGKSATTPKISPGIIQALMNMGGPPGGSPAGGNGVLPNASPMTSMAGPPPGRGMV